ncbi:MAG: glycine--tRNA ligase subunit beta [Candidatus Eisenbacteria bacterium]|nr:glycine--tRNA ligase subunit beta [Candidatus Eisenbacteria bacterium]
MSAPGELLFEIGVEELPAGYVPPALEQLERGVRAGLEELRLGFDQVTGFATPRRIAVLVTGVAARQRDHEEEAMGPAAKVAFDAAGQPTKALVGFCAGRGVDVSAVRRVATPKGEYVAVTVQHVGRPAADVLPAMLGALAPKLQFPKTLRWDAGDWRFGRPVRWLVALLDDQVLPVRAFGLTAGRTSFGHRFLHPDAVEIASPGGYVEAMRRAFVVVDPRERRQAIERQIARLAEARGGRIVADDELTDINNFLIEWPTSVEGAFAANYLDLPREVIVTALREHQRFFALERADGSLLPGFVTVRNGDDRGLERVRKGNEDVLVARLEDAKFYWETDLRQTPADNLEKLSAVVWMEGLGSLRDKAARLESLAGWLADRLAPPARPAVVRAALLCKTDLLGEMIGSGKEYASLEGVMGGHYARRAGEPEAVASAIAEHYRPRGAGDALPETDAGSLLSLADKLDHVAGAFVAGKSPSGSEDPYGVRRAANGAVRIVLEQSRALDLRAAAMEMTRPFFAADPDLAQAEIMKKLGEFLRARVDAALEERGVPYDTREAALEARIHLGGATRPGWCDAADALARGRALEAFRGDPRFAPLVLLDKRVANILRAATEPLPASLDRARLAEPAERSLLAALEAARAGTAPLWDAREYAKIIPALLGMEGAIHGFFDQVLVNAGDAAVRLNRLRLLSEVRELFVRGWDLSKVVVEGGKA